MHRSSFHIVSLLLLVIILLAAAAPAGVLTAASPRAVTGSDTAMPTMPTGTLAQQADEDTPSNPFTSDIQEIEVTIPLGQQQVIPITLTNSATLAAQPDLHTALPGTPPGVTPRRTAPLPDALRQVALPDQAERVDSQILQDIAAAPDGRTEFLVFLDEQPDLSAAYAISDWAERGRFVYATLSTNAEESQRDVRSWLDAHNIAYRPLWIVNALAVEGSTSEVQSLAQRHDVALLRANYTASLGAPAEAEPITTTETPTDTAHIAPQQTDSEDETIAWNVRKVGADRVWYDFGISGQGITVANNDNGVNFEHPALLQQYRGYSSAGQINHDYNWYDPNNAEVSLENAGDHGTHTMGTIVARGNGTVQQPAYGVAPGARWMTARGCQTVTCRDADLIEAAQWLLAPTDGNDQNPRPDLRPHIINNSWAGSEQSDWYMSYVTAWRAAGIFPIFVTGNTTGISCGSVVSPGDYANALSIGSTDREDQISSFSRVGPTGNGSIKPDLTAPGSNIRSTIAGGNGYGVLQGTSMAAPHVAGTVALLWSANPALIGDYDATYDILIETAIPITDMRFNDAQYAECPARSVPNNIYGYGRLDTYAAVAKAKVDVPWLQFPETIARFEAEETRTISVTLDTRHVVKPGTYGARILVGTGDLSQTPTPIDIELTVPDDPNHIQVNGRIEAERTNEPLTGVVEITDGPRLQVGDSGTFAVTLPEQPDTYTFKITSSGYVTKSVTLPLLPGEVEELVVSLLPDVPRALVHTDAVEATLDEGEYANRVVRLENIGTQPLTYSMKVINEPFSITRSDGASASATTANWIATPSSSIPITLTDDGLSEPLPLGFSFPFYDRSYTSVTVYANGVLVLGTPIETEYFFVGCLPVAETDQAALVPLRADLDPSLGGNVSYGYVPDGFLITFENVPLHQDPSQTFTFQVLIAPDGHVVYNYGPLAALPDHVSVGAQGSNAETFAIGCGDDTPIYSGLTLELQPQPDPSSWIRLTQESKGIVGAGLESHLPLRLTWIEPRENNEPYTGRLLLTTNDIELEAVELPVTLITQGTSNTPTGPTHSLWLPTLRKGG